MSRERIKSRILNIILSEKCERCYTEGISCELSPGSRERTVFIDFQQGPLLLGKEFNCQLRKNPHPTEREMEENAKSLRSLRKKLGGKTQTIKAPV